MSHLWGASRDEWRRGMPTAQGSAVHVIAGLADLERPCPPVRKDAPSVFVELNRRIDDDRGAESLVIAVGQHRLENLDGLIRAIHRRGRGLLHTIPQIGVAQAGRGTPTLPSVSFVSRTPQQSTILEEASCCDLVDLHSSTRNQGIDLSTEIHQYWH